MSRFSLTFFLFWALFFLPLGARAQEEIWLGCFECYGSASFYAQVAQELFPGKSIRWIHLRPKEPIPVAYRGTWEATRHRYVESHELDSDNAREFREMIVHLKRRGVLRVFGGMDSGSWHADLFNEALRASGNDPATRARRRHKAEQQVALGNMAIPTLYTADPGEIRRFVREQKAARIILKPNASSGGEMVTLLPGNAVETIVSTAAGMIGSFDLYGQLVDRVVVQPVIEGEEYVANTISLNGVTTLVGLWKYFKIKLPNGKRVYFVDRAIELDSPEGKDLAALMPKINLRLGNVNGPGHAELIKEYGTGRWYLIEQGPRIGGSGLPLAEAQIWGTSHLHLNLLMTLDPARFHRELADFPRRKRQDGSLVSLVSLGKGRILPGTNAFFRSLRTFKAPAPYYEIEDGSAVEETVDMPSSPYTAALIGSNVAVSSDTFEIIRAQADGRIYKYDEPQPSCATWLLQAIERYHGLAM